MELLAAQDGGEEEGEERLEINDDWRKVSSMRFIHAIWGCSEEAARACVEPESTRCLWTRLSSPPTTRRAPCVLHNRSLSSFGPVW